MSAPQSCTLQPPWTEKHKQYTCLHPLPENPVDFLAQLRENSQRVQPSLEDCVGLISWCVAALEELVTCSKQEMRTFAERSAEDNQMQALLVAAELLRNGKRGSSKGAVDGNQMHEEVDVYSRNDGSNFTGCDVLGDRASSPPPSEELNSHRSTVKPEVRKEKEAAKALLDFGRRVNDEESLRDYFSRTEKRPADRKINRATVRGHEDAEAKVEQPPAKKKSAHQRKMSVDSAYDPYTRPVYMPLHRMVCDPLLSVSHSVPPTYYVRSHEDMMTYAKTHQQPLSHVPMSCPTMPAGLMRPHHVVNPHIAHVPPSYLPSVTALPPAALQDAAPPTLSAARRSIVSPDLAVNSVSLRTDDDTHSSTPKKAVAKRKCIRWPEEWDTNRPVHGSRYVYEGRTCRLQWEQEGKVFGFECFEQLRCKFFDGRFSIISTGDIIQLQDSRVYVLLGTARDVVPRNHQYDTWMICYNFAGYRGMEVVFVELKWLQSVLSGPEEIPADHQNVDYSSVEDALERFTKHPSFYRRHSIASSKFRRARSRKDRSGSKTSEDDEYNDLY